MWLRAAKVIEARLGMSFPKTNARRKYITFESDDFSLRRKKNLASSVQAIFKVGTWIKLIQNVQRCSSAFSPLLPLSYPNQGDFLQRQFDYSSESTTILNFVRNRTLRFAQRPLFQPMKSSVFWRKRLASESEIIKSEIISKSFYLETFSANMPSIWQKMTTPLRFQTWTGSKNTKNFTP